MKKILLFGALGAVVLLIVVVLLHSKQQPIVTNFDQCVAQGYRQTETIPQVCTTPAGVSYTQSEGAPTPQTTPAEQSLQFETLVIATNGPVKPERAIITNQRDWQAFWQRTHAHLTPFPNLTPVDFTKNEVIAIVDGQKPSAGYVVKVTTISELADKILVYVEDKVPPKGCIVTASLTSPYVIVQLAKVTKPIQFSNSVTSVGNTCPVKTPSPY